MKDSAKAVLNKKIGFGARLGRNSGIVYVVLFGLMLALVGSLIVKERTLERTMIVLPAVSTASSGWVLGGSSWSDLSVTYPDGRVEVVRHDFPVRVGTERTVYMLPDAPSTLQLNPPSVTKALSRSWWMLAIFSAGLLLGLFLVFRAGVIKRDAQNATLHGVPYSAKVTHIGKVWLPGTLRFLGYVKWQDTSGKIARSMTLTTKEADQFKIGDTVAVRAGSKRDWLLAELDLLN